jgi:hypothetical protein
VAYASVMRGPQPMTAFTGGTVSVIPFPVNGIQRETYAEAHRVGSVAAKGVTVTRDGQEVPVTALKPRSPVSIPETGRRVLTMVTVSAESAAANESPTSIQGNSVTLV